MDQKKVSKDTIRRLPSALVQYLLAASPFIPEKEHAVFVFERAKFQSDQSSAHHYDKDDMSIQQREFLQYLDKKFYEPWGEMAITERLMSECMSGRMPDDRYTMIVASPITSKRVVDADYAQRAEIIALRNILGAVRHHAFLGRHRELPTLVRAVMPVGFTFDKRLTDFRREIVKDFSVTSVSHVDHEIFGKYTSNNICIIELLYPKREIATQFIKLKLTGDTLVPVSSMEDRRGDILNPRLTDDASDLNWNPEYHFMNESGGDPVALVTKYSTIYTLGSLSTLIARGKAVTPDECADEGGDHTHLIANIGDIQDNKVCFENMRKGVEKQRPRAKEFKRSFEAYEIQDNDILVTCRGSEVKTALYRERDLTEFIKANRLNRSTKLVASLNVIIIRMNPDMKEHPPALLADFIAMYFKLPTGKNQLRLIQRGSTIVNINPGDVAQLNIPIPPENTMLHMLDQLSAAENNVKKAQLALKKTIHDIQQGF